MIFSWTTSLVILVMLATPILAQEAQGPGGNFRFSFRNGDEIDLELNFDCQSQPTNLDQAQQIACQGRLVKEDSEQTSSLEAEGTFTLPRVSD